MVYFTDYFRIGENVLEDYGAFNISLINDLPLFIDPFLIFGSEKTEYKSLHDDILKYLSFLKEKSAQGGVTDAEIESWYMFPEVRQNWLGFSVNGNGGSGLGEEFGNAMSQNMHIIFRDLYKESVTKTSHLEKAGLFHIGVGRDNISDFTCNLIKAFLLEYTEGFATKFLEKSQVRKINVSKVYFSYKHERWMPKEYILPIFSGDYIILTPKDLLTKDENWINSHELRGDFISICNTIPNTQLRNEINSYFKSYLPPIKIIGKGKKARPKKPSKKAISEAAGKTIIKFPEILDYYIKKKEAEKDDAKSVADENVKEVQEIFQDNVLMLIEKLTKNSYFYNIKPITSLEESLKRVQFMKDVIEKNDGYKLFYYKGKPIQRESDLQVIYRLTWFSSAYDINREVNNGRGSVDYSISMGAKDKTLIEFKLASNSKLKINLQKQVEIYEKANNTSSSIKVILYFTNEEYLRTCAIIEELGLENDDKIVLIDAGDNKPSASNAK